jgi:hypothetical protein
MSKQDNQSRLKLHMSKQDNQNRLKLHMSKQDNQNRLGFPILYGRIIPEMERVL